MAAAPSSFEQYFERTPTSAPSDPDTNELIPWNSWEAWITLTLVLLVQLPVVGSIQSSNWVGEMPSLVVPALVGLATAWVLAHTRISRAVGIATTFIVGAITVMSLVMHTMVLIDPEASGVLTRWWEFRFRLLEWGRAVVGDGISTDPLPFVVLLVALMFLVGFISTWAVVRWRNPWVALIPGGIVLLTNISYLPGQPSFSFILFLLAAIMLVTRLTFVDALLRWRRQGMSPTDGMSIEVLLVGGAIASILVISAWVIPTANNWGPVADAWNRALAPVQERVDRFGQLFVGIASKKPIPVHAMGGVLPLQGSIALDQDVLFEVQAPEDVLLRGAVYDEYTGSGWRVSSVAAVPLSPGGVEAAQFGTAASRQALQEAVRIDVTVLHDSAPSGVLLGAGDPIATSAAADLVFDRGGGPLQLRSTETVAVMDTYSTVATRSVASAETLAAAGQDYPAAIMDRYLALPDGMSPEVRELTLSLVGGAGSPYDAARLIEAHLRSNYTFDFEISPPPPGEDAVEHFLLESRAGYFDLFSSSMAVMLRSIGIPSRVAVGFAPERSDYDSATKTYRITEERAWSWPEVYFPGLGWVEFNPTPTRPPAVRPGDDSSARAAADLLVPDDSLLFGGEVLEELTDDGFVDYEALLGTAEGGTSLLARVVGWVMVGATILVAAVVVVRLVWDRTFRGLDPRSRRWAKLLWFAARAGLRPPPARTPIEVATDLATRTGEAEAWRSIASSFNRARYGGPSAPPEDDETARAQTAEYRRVRGTLVRLMMRRIVRLGRTPQGQLARRLPATRPAR
ncbi:MAG: DUF4129 domain-containing protein [Chloroflexi bacterium]|nr:DUF4129 domain-containing protein [Chloroflexota bacterium]